MSAARPKRRGSPPAIDAAGWTRLVRTRTKVTRRAVLHVVLGLLLYGAGANVSAGWVVVLAAMVLGTLPWAWVTARRASRDVAIRRDLPARATAGIPVAVAVEVWAATSASVVVLDELTATVGVADAPREGARLESVVLLPRGRLAGGRVRAHTGDAFGLVEVTLEGEVATDCEVLPAVPSLRTGAGRAAWAVEPGSNSVRPGSGAEIIGVREYRQGDPLRALHWRSTARRGQLVVRELADEGRPRVVVEIAAGDWEMAALDRATEAAAGIATEIRRAGLPVQLAADGASQPWSPAAHRHLALLPPHPGAAPRPLAAAPHTDAEIRVVLTAAGDDLAVAVTSGRDHHELGTIPGSAGLDDLEAWLNVRLGAHLGAGSAPARTTAASGGRS